MSKTMAGKNESDCTAIERAAAATESEGALKMEEIQEWLERKRNPVPGSMCVPYVG